MPRYLVERLFLNGLAIPITAEGINAGSDSVCVAAPVSSTAQNGVTRPQGSHCDIGAYELGIYKLFLPLILR